MIPREAAEAVRRLSRGFPVIHITGPRQSGKTTLARAVRSDLPYASLENPDQRAFAQEDPIGFLAQFPDGVILDEAQRVPDLVSWLQGIVDAGGTMGRFVLTGSQQPELSAQLSQSLAGRIGRVELLPLSGRELAAVDRLPEDLDDVLWTGGYPAIYDRDVSPTDWLSSYVSTYVERDVRQLINVRNQTDFTRFVRAVAARSNQLLNAANLGADIGVSAQTARSWLSVLRATYVTTELEPWHANVTTRIVKAPKIVMLDVGLASWLIGIREPAQLAHHPLRGSLFETWGVTELLKAFANSGRSVDVGFLRDSRGVEVDLVVSVDGRMVPIEFKAGRTYAPDWAQPARKWAQRMAESTWADPIVVYGGDDSYIRSGVRVRSWRAFAAAPLDGVLADSGHTERETALPPNS